MQRLSNGTQVSSLPAPIAIVGTPGFATPGNPATPTPASDFDADQYNRIQEEIVSVILAAEITLDPGNNAQLLAAIRALVTGSFTDTLAAEGTPGILTLPTGAIIQCFPTPEINVALANTVYGYNLVFPEAFPSYCSAIHASDGGVDGTSWDGFSGVTNVGCGGTVWSINPNNAARGFVTAIGR